MNRRSFLKFLGVAPLIPVAAKAVAPPVEPDFDWWEKTYPPVAVRPWPECVMDGTSVVRSGYGHVLGEDLLNDAEWTQKWGTYTVRIDQQTGEVVTCHASTLREDKTP